MYSTKKNTFPFTFSQTFRLLSSLHKTREELQADLAIPIEYKISVIVHLLLLSAAAAGEAAADDIWVVK